MNRRICCNLYCICNILRTVRSVQILRQQRIELNDGRSEILRRIFEPRL